MSEVSQAGGSLRADGSLKADCAQCAALCCVAATFAVSADFAIDKPAGTPCPNLTGFRCGVHSALRERGFPGCVAFDCFGAGQAVTQRSFAGRDWRSHPELGPQMFSVFNTMRALHSMLWHLEQARGFAPPAMWGALDEALAATRAHTTLPPEALDGFDLSVPGRASHALLERASAAAREEHTGQARRRRVKGKALRGQDLEAQDYLGADLRGADLRGASLLGALLIAADLRGADLREADLRAADLRAADLRGADLRGALFVTGAQLRSCKGDGATRLPAGVERPESWSTGSQGGEET